MKRRGKAEQKASRKGEHGSSAALNWRPITSSFTISTSYHITLDTQHAGARSIMCDGVTCRWIQQPFFRSIRSPGKQFVMFMLWCSRYSRPLSHPWIHLGAVNIVIRTWKLFARFTATQICILRKYCRSPDICLNLLLDAFICFLAVWPS